MASAEAQEISEQMEQAASEEADTPIIPLHQLDPNGVLTVEMGATRSQVLRLVGAWMHYLDHDCGPALNFLLMFVSGAIAELYDQAIGLSDE